MNVYALIRLSALFSSFGTEVSPNKRPSGIFPGRASLVGLIGNCLGLDTSRVDDVAVLENMQHDIQFAAVILRNGKRFTDYQNAFIGENLETFAKRENSVRPGNFQAAAKNRFDADPWDKKSKNKQIWKQYLAGHDVLVAIRFASAVPSLDQVAQALRSPARMPYIGRKACLLTAPLYAGVVTAATALQALRDAIPDIIAGMTNTGQHPDKDYLSALWDSGEGPDGTSNDQDAADRSAAPQTVADVRIWALGRHGGTRRVNVGQLVVADINKSAEIAPC